MFLIGDELDVKLKLVEIETEEDEVRGDLYSFIVVGSDGEDAVYMYKDEIEKANPEAEMLILLERQEEITKRLKVLEEGLAGEDVQEDNN